MHRVARKRSGKRVTTTDGVKVYGRNANGEGSVYKTKDGRWRATWPVPGQKRPKSVSAKTREDAIRRRAEKMGRPAATETLTVAELADWWLDNIYRQSVSEDSWLKAEERLPRIKAGLGTLNVQRVGYAEVVEWQAALSRGDDIPKGTKLAPKTVRNYRSTLALMFDEAVRLGKAQGNPVRTVKAPSRKDASSKSVVTAEQARSLLRSAREDRLGAAVAILFLQGWRVSEVLGLAWPDIDFDTGRVLLSRVSVYRRGTGQLLKPRAKSDGAHGEHWLAPTALAFLEERRRAQAEERVAAGEQWSVPEMNGRPVDAIFTNTTGGLVLRQHVEKAVRRSATKAGIDPTGLATHGGRRSVVTAMWSEGGESLEDIAQFIGHADTATTAGYVKRLGKRPQDVAGRAAALLDPSY